MNTFTIHSNTLNKGLLELKEQLNAEAVSNFKEKQLTFNNVLGKGQIVGVALKGRINYLEFNVTFKEDTQVLLGTETQNSLFFAYCVDGSLSHKFSEHSETIVLEPFQTAIMANSISPINVLEFKANEPTNVSIIGVYGMQEADNPETIKYQLKETFIKDKKEDYRFVGSYNLKIADSIRQLNNLKMNGMVRALMTEGLVHIILAMEIQQHHRDSLLKDEALGSLNSRDRKMVKEVSDFIQNYPETNKTVVDLASKVGISPAKLQEGFRLMHKTTVNDFIRNERINKAEMLLKTTDFTISEIVYTIGFSSRSYFSKIFKEKYNCSPVEYKSKIKMAVTA